MAEAKVSLRWNPRAFIPTDVQELAKGVEETFVPSEVAQWSDADIRAYWSVPEKLMDLGWLFWKEQNPGVVDASQIRRLQRLEFYLYDFVRRLLVDIRAGQRDLNKLERLASLEERESRWRETSQEALQWYDRAEAENRGDEILRDQRVPGMARELTELDLTGLRWKQLKRLVGIAAAVLRQTPLDDPQQRARAIRMRRSLCQGVLDVFGSDQWEKIRRKPRERITRLEKRYGKILKRQAPEKARRLDVKKKLLESDSVHSGYEHPLAEGQKPRLWLVIEQAMMAYTQMTPLEAGNSQLFEELVQKVQENMGRFIKAAEPGGKLSKRKKKTLQAYCQDGTRCVAMIRWQEPGKVHKYVAFSGYLDCSDQRILEVKGLSKMGEMERVARNAFKQICRALSSRLVTYERDLKSYVWRYALDSSAAYLPLTTLGKELGIKGSADEEKEKRKVLRYYSCCERKILGYLEEKKIRPHADVTVIVKFEPCVQCYAALSLWKKELETKGLGLLLDCPGVKEKPLPAGDDA